MKGYKGKRKVDTCDSSKQVNFFFFFFGDRIESMTSPSKPNLWGKEMPFGQNKYILILVNMQRVKMSTFYNTVIEIQRYNIAVEDYPLVA